MASYKLSDGTVGVEATASKADHDQAKAENKRADESARKIEAEAKRERERAAAAVPTQSERFQTITLGVSRLAARAKRVGEKVKAEKLAALADQMAGALETFRKAKKAEAEPCAEPLKDAITAAAAELKKALPKCFATLEDAADYAGRYIPLTAARIEQVRENDRRGNLGKTTAKAASAFWSLAEKAARAASGSVCDTAIKELETAGSL